MEYRDQGYSFDGDSCQRSQTQDAPRALLASGPRGGWGESPPNLFSHARWRAERRAAYFAGKCCAKCTSTDRLELDHIQRAGKVTHRIWSWSRPRRETELAKCQVLCHGCHREKTIAENTKPLVHGTRCGYRQKRCRCVDCLAWHAADVRAWRASHPEVRQ